MSASQTAADNQLELVEEVVDDLAANFTGERVEALTASDLLDVLAIHGLMLVPAESLRTDGVTIPSDAYFRSLGLREGER